MSATVKQSLYGDFTGAPEPKTGIYVWYREGVNLGGLTTGGMMLR
jgi:hypothetical protein